MQQLNFEKVDLGLEQLKNVFNYVLKSNNVIQNEYVLYDFYYNVENDIVVFILWNNMNNDSVNLKYSLKEILNYYFEQNNITLKQYFIDDISKNMLCYI